MVDSSSTTSSSSSQARGLRLRRASEEVIRGFFNLLGTECERHCILAGYEPLPGVISDIDFIVSKLDIGRLPRLLKSFADQSGFRLVQVHDRGKSARCFVLVRLDADELIYLRLVAVSDGRADPMKCLAANDVLARKRLHSGGFCIPSPADAFLYHLIRLIENRSLDAVHGARLAGLYREDPDGCSRELAAHCSESLARCIMDAAASNDWDSIIQLVHPTMRPRTADAADVRSLRPKLSRLLKPTGSWIAFFGPDGSGKSSLIKALADAIHPAFNNLHCYHLRPELLLSGASGARAAVTNPHGKPARSLFASLAKLAVFCCDYVGGYWFCVRPRMVNSTFVIFDRYFHDLLVDARRYRYKAPRWVTSLVGSFIPLPDLVFILDAPPELLQARKQEVSFEESKRQCEAYKRLAENLSVRTRTVVIDTSRPLDESVQAAILEIFRFLESRTARRYHIC